ncbi:MAG: Type restriction enzyme specificity subunit, partial [Bacillales bacterium]|nr:Type restriction enzyme specificity subunit [Bacillales bacterium]
MDKNKVNVPKIRFPGFEGPWKQCKLGELVTQVIREIDKPNEPYWKMSVRSHAKGTFRQFVDEPQKVAMDKLYVVHEDDLVVNITFAWEHAIAVASKEDTGMLVSHRFPMYRADGKSDIKFLKYLVSQEYFRRNMDLISPGGAGRNRVLSKSEFLKIEVVVPCKIEE